MNATTAIGASSAIKQVADVLSICIERSKGGRLLTMLDDTAPLCELINALIQLLRQGIQCNESFLMFFRAASDIIPRAPEIHDVLDKVFDSPDVTISSMPLIQKERVYILFSFQHPGALMRTVQRCCRLSDTMRQYYHTESPFFCEEFTSQVHSLLMRLARLKLKSPSIEDGLRALHYHDVNVAAAEAKASPPGVGTLGGNGVVEVATGTTMAIPTVSSASLVASKSPSSEVMMNSAFVPEDANTCEAVAASVVLPPTPVLIKKKKRTKQFVDAATQASRIEDSPFFVQGAAVVKHRSVGQMTSFETRSSTTQTLVAFSTDSPTTGVLPSPEELLRWEARLLERERQLEQKLREAQECLFLARQRESIMLDVGGGTSGSPVSTHRFSGDVLSTSNGAASPSRGRRSLSRAIQNFVEHAQEDTQPSSVTHYSGNFNSSKHIPVGSTSSTFSDSNDVVASGGGEASPSPSPLRREHSVAASSPPPKSVADESVALKERPKGSRAATTIDWIDRSVGLDPLAVAESQGWCCASCFLPVGCEELPEDDQVPLGDSNGYVAGESEETTLSSSIPHVAESILSTMKRLNIPRVAERLLRKSSSSPSNVSSTSEVQQKVTASSSPPHRPLEPQRTTSGDDNDDTSSSRVVVVHSCGYRFCYYSGAIYCKSCLSDNSRFIIPAKLITSWDTAIYPVCNEAVRKLMDSLDEMSLVPSTMTKDALACWDKVPELLVVRGLRKQLRILASIVSRCRGPLPNELRMILQSRFVLLNEPYSLRDLIQIVIAGSSAAKASELSWLIRRAADERKPDRATVKPQPPLLEDLKQMRDALALHCAKHCDCCKANSSRPCCLCSDRRPLYVFDVQRVTTCGSCNSVFHNACWEMAGSVCEKCK